MGMNAALGIAQPLVAVRDADAAAARWQALGFTPEPAERQPWGTMRRVIRCAGRSVALIGIEDAAAGGHVLGGLIAGGLKRGEGVAALALHSADLAADTAAIEARGGWSAGVVAMRGDAGAAELAVLPDDAFPDLAVLLCQPHAPAPPPPPHPNGCDALTAAFVLAPRPDRVAGRLATIWGAGAVAAQAGGLLVETGGAALHVLDEAALLRRFSGMRLPVGAARRAPSVVALSLHTTRFATLVIGAMQMAGVRVEEGAMRRVLVPAAQTGGVIMEVCG